MLHSIKQSAGALAVVPGFTSKQDSKKYIKYILYKNKKLSLSGLSGSLCVALGT